MRILLPLSSLSSFSTLPPVSSSCRVYRVIAHVARVPQPSLVVSRCASRPDTRASLLHQVYSLARTRLAYEYRAQHTQLDYSPREPRMPLPQTRARTLCSSTLDAHESSVLLRDICGLSCRPCASDMSSSFVRPVAFRLLVLGGPPLSLADATLSLLPDMRPSSISVLRARGGALAVPCLVPSHAPFWLSRARGKQYRGSRGPRVRAVSSFRGTGVCLGGLHVSLSPSRRALGCRRGKGPNSVSHGAVRSTTPRCYRNGAVRQPQVVNDSEGVLWTE